MKSGVSSRIRGLALNAAKGTGVHRLKGHPSWVQNGVSQFGLYLLEVFLSEGKEGQVRKERPSVASGVPVV